MIKIFSKLKHILIITVILITVLFAILIFRQYTQLDMREAENETESLINISQDFTLVYSLYQKLASTYYNESIKKNYAFLKELKSYNKPIDGIAKEDTRAITSLLEASFNSALKDQFSYFKIYTPDNTLICALSNEVLNDGTNYNYRFPLYYTGDIIGYFEMGLSLEAFIDTLHQLTGLTSFTLFRTTEYSSFDAINSPNDFNASFFGEHFFVNDITMSNYYETIPAHEIKILEDFATTIASIVYEPLMQNEDYIIHKQVNNKFYTLNFIAMDSSLRNKGYFVHFEENESITELHDNLTINLILFVVLYLTLVSIIGFVYYILNYLYQFSYTDHLTKAYNRHKFFEVIERNIYDNHRYQYMFSIILIDIDNFKNINDTYGHNTGDQILIDLVKIIEESLRNTDYLFRWGGEEFLVLLSHCHQDIGYQVSEKLRKNLENYDFHLPENKKVTASFGVASYDGCDSIEEMISNADKALYISKDQGKNKSTIYSGS